VKGKQAMVVMGKMMISESSKKSQVKVGGIEDERTWGWIKGKILDGDARMRRLGNLSLGSCWEGAQ